MKFKNFYMLSEINDYVATTSEPGGKDTILSDLKSFGYNGFKERTDAINLDLAKKINFSEVRFSGDYRHVLNNLRKAGWVEDKVLYSGLDIKTVVIKKGDYLIQLRGDNKPLNGKPYCEMRIVDSKRNLSDDEVKHLINLTSDTSPGSRILDNSKPIWVQTFSIEALKSYLENHPHCSKKTKDLIDKEIKTRSAVGYTTDRQTAPNVDKGIFRDTAPSSHGGTDHKFNESVLDETATLHDEFGSEYYHERGLKTPRERQSHHKTERDYFNDKTGKLNKTLAKLHANAANHWAKVSSDSFMDR